MCCHVVSWTTPPYIRNYLQLRKSIYTTPSWRLLWLGDGRNVVDVEGCLHCIFVTGDWWGWTGDLGWGIWEFWQSVLRNAGSDLRIFNVLTVRVKENYIPIFLGTGPVQELIPLIAPATFFCGQTLMAPCSPYTWSLNQSWCCVDMMQ
jgi:hypothetical protein